MEVFYFWQSALLLIVNTISEPVSRNIFFIISIFVTGANYRIASIDELKVSTWLLY
jgi:hypothetical protein